MTDSLSIHQARKLILLSQHLPTTRQEGSAVSATLSTIEHLGYIQIDTISAIQRAHHHTLWNRNPRYKISHLENLLEDKRIFEYWSHAAAYLPMRDYRYSLIRKKAFAQGDQDHWYERDPGLMRSVMKRIADEGPLMSKDFEEKKKFRGEWSYKPAKRALEYLFMQGELMIPRRENFQKVYDLTERVLPENIDTSTPDTKEYGRFLITRFLKANGLGKTSEISYLQRNTKTLVENTLFEMLSANELIRVDIKGDSYFALPDSLEVLNMPLVRNKVKILSPFDNLLIQRKRIQNFFDFDYMLECYTPAEKRQYGYFSLPVLWDGKLVARVDCKAERKSGMLNIQHLVLEPGLKKTEAFASALSKEIENFMRFNNCIDLKLHKTTPAAFKEVLENSYMSTKK